MESIILYCGNKSFSTTCNGTSQHIHDRVVVHGITKEGFEWFCNLEEDHPRVMVETPYGTNYLDYFIDDPLP